MIVQVPWTDAADAAMRSKWARDMDILRREVERGISQLWHFSDGRDSAYCITRTELEPREFVVCYFQGSGLVKFGRLLRDAAHAKGMPLRFHTEQPAVARLARRLGARLDCYVLRMALP